MNIGFVGTGVMGGAMAGHLQAGGHQLLLFRHRSNPPAELVVGGARIYTSLEQVGREADIAITMLPDTPDVEAALFGDQGLAAGLRPGSLLIDMSSISPVATKTFAAKLTERQIDFLDAPVSGGQVGAKAATLSIMVGGSAVVFERARPVLALMGKNISHIGEAGDGQTAKVANQIIVGLTIQAVAEGLLFAAKAGADPARVREALMGGFASSRVLEVHGDRMVKRTFDPGFRIALHSKDLRLALEGAQSLGLALPATAGIQQLLNSCMAAGNGGLDHSALVTALEVLADYKLASAG